jgi:hypothetical protein
MRFWLSLVLSAPVWAQSWYPSHNLTVGLGAAQPRADLEGLFSKSAGLSINYGYRFHPNFQADLGLDTVFYAARVRDFLPTGFGDLRIRDYQFLVPFGARAILPLERGRLQLSAGGGGAYLRYSELLSQPSDYFRLACRVCAVRSGWGYYGLVGGRVALDRRQRFHAGVTTRVYQGHTDGAPLGFLPDFRTRDRWVNLFGEFGVSF